MNRALLGFWTMLAGAARTVRLAMARARLRRREDQLDDVHRQQGELIQMEAVLTEDIRLANIAVRKAMGDAS